MHCNQTRTQMHNICCFAEAATSHWQTSPVPGLTLTNDKYAILSIFLREYFMCFSSLTVFFLACDFIFSLLSNVNTFNFMREPRFMCVFFVCLYKFVCAICYGWWSIWLFVNHSTFIATIFTACDELIWEEF